MDDPASYNQVGDKGSVGLAIKILPLALGNKGREDGEDAQSAWLCV